MNDTRAVALEPAVRAQGLTKRYGDVLAVDRLELELPAGQFFGLLGPNGSGKTTTIHMLSTLVRPCAGTALVAGHDVVRDPVAVRGSIGLVFQESALDRTLSVSENLRFAGLLYDLAPSTIEERSRELLELFGLNDKRNRPVGALSGGMRRALDIVRGVIHRPRILFLDEPTIGLDLPNRRAIWRFIERLRASTGMTVLLTTHYLEEADGCDQVAFIKSGKIVQRGTPQGTGGVARAGTSSRSRQPGSTHSSPPSSRAWGRHSPTVTSPCSATPTRTPALWPRCRPSWPVGVSALRIRRPNLNDVFLWVNSRR